MQKRVSVRIHVGWRSKSGDVKLGGMSDHTSSLLCVFFTPRHDTLDSMIYLLLEIERVTLSLHSADNVRLLLVSTLATRVYPRSFQRLMVSRKRPLPLGRDPFAVRNNELQTKCKMGGCMCFVRLSIWRSNRVDPLKHIPSFSSSIQEQFVKHLSLHALLLDASDVEDDSVYLSYCCCYMLHVAQLRVCRPRACLLHSPRVTFTFEKLHITLSS